jgi:hypothetical protein
VPVRKGTPGNNDRYQKGTTMYIRRALSLLLATLLLSVAGMSVATATEGAPQQDRDTTAKRDVHPPEPVARLQLAGGSELIFYEMLANDGSSRGIGVGQFIPARGMDPSTVRELRGANPHEIFYALSKRGTDVPGLLREYHPNRFEKLPQGWALERIRPSVFKNLFSCGLSEQIVTNAVAATGLPHIYSELSKGPHNWALWSVEDPNALFPSYYTTNGVSTTGDAYYHVMLCEEDPNFTNTSVHVRLSYEETDGPYGYGTVIGQGELHWALHNVGDQMSFMSWPFDSDLAGDNNWSWMLTVEDVFHNDTLHIGTAWS